MKTKIINILPHPPAYEYIRNNERPKINWDIPNGSWVGMWRGDWPDLIGSEILKLTKEFEYEVWRSDLRADRIYCHRFENGIIHKSFPAVLIKKMIGLKIVNTVSSQRMLESLENPGSKKFLMHINTPGSWLSQEIIEMFSQVPKIVEFHSKLTTPYMEMKKLRYNIFANIFYLRQHLNWLKNKNMYFVYNNAQDLSSLKKYNNIGIKRIFMGCDFNFWIPGNSNEFKKKFNIKDGTLIFSMTSRFNRLKQIDQIIKILTEIDKERNYDFKLFIAGHGEAKYENYLRNISCDLSKKHKVFFLEYLSDENLLDLYQTTDFFISASTSEGGPVSVIKAIACGIPMICTKVGGVDDVLEQHNAGILVDRYDYKQWKETFIEILNGKIKIRKMDREMAKEIFHWPNIAKKFISIYKKLCHA
jgi:glycosyltransferase involved in cell wall biosynthesis